MGHNQEENAGANGYAALDQMGPAGKLFNLHLRRIDAILIRATEKVWRKKTFRRGTVGALSYIVAHPGSSQNDLVAAISVDKSSMHAIVSRLEKLGWATRRRSEEDRRRYEVYATSQGERELIRMVSEIEVIESRLMAGMTDAEKTQLAELLDRAFASFIHSNI